MKSLFAVLGTLLIVSGCAQTEMHSAHDCFESAGLLVFDSSGDVGCMGIREYALAKETSGQELVSVTPQADPLLETE